MIISINRYPSLAEFESLVSAATIALNNDAAYRSAYYLTRNGHLLEEDVVNTLKATSVGSPFEGTIHRISGQKFPDIVAAKYYDVEVKSSKDEKWQSLGGSVNESTRIEDVERIFLTFGKLVNPVEFRSRPYEECLSDVVVTHYPRYKIDMKLNDNETIFKKMNMTYDNLRLASDPVGSIVDFYKSKLGKGESLWWTGSATQDDPAEVAPMTVRLWNALTLSEKQRLNIIGFAYFPELLSNSSRKYERFSLWLATSHGVVNTSTRDSFSAGGQGTIVTSSARYDDLPRAFIKIYENHVDISKIILEANESVLRETWRVGILVEDRVGQWIDCVCKLRELENHDTRLVLESIFDRR